MKNTGHDGNSAGVWSLTDMGQFYQTHRRNFVTYASKYLYDKAQAEEVVQDALLKVLLSAPELESEDHAKAYMFRTIKNQCIDISKVEGRRPQLVVLDDVTAEIEEKFTSEDLSEALSAAEDAALIRQALSLLSPAERAALVMWEIEGRSSEEIARELGVGKSTVRHTISRARFSLRKILTEYVIDEKRQLTTFDLLSVSYEKSKALAKKSSKVVMSILILLTAFLGFNEIKLNPGEVSNNPRSAETFSGPYSSQSSFTSFQSDVLQTSASKSDSQKPGSTNFLKDVSATKVNVKAAPLWFEGLDKNGIPIGFSVTDSLGNRGSLFFSPKEAIVQDDQLILSSVAKTRSGAANILLTQALTQGAQGLTYDALVSYGRADHWIPLTTEVISTDFERLVSGDYLVTAIIQVKSEVESPIVIPASTEGRDLVSAPSRIVTRFLLDSAKSKVLAQAIQVVEKKLK